MIRISPNARRELVRHLEGQKAPRIRIFRVPGGCCGSRMALTLDEQRPMDAVVECDGLVFIMHRDLLRDMAPIRIDASLGGLIVSSEKETANGCQ